ncbi:hypothetical protein FACS1894103_6070 [Campylobacterota bacterium]|nr:hypothetical protein FACS1894103_6070 [Campylobacterota bacterium]
MGARILVVEDESIIAMNICEILREEGYEPIGVAANGERARALAAQKSPDLVLMDITLQNGEDGIALAQEITRLRTVPIVFLTANDRAKTIARAGEVEPYGYVLKPFKRAELAIAISIALRKHAAVSAAQNECAALRDRLHPQELASLRLIALRDGYAYDHEAKRLLHNGEIVELGDREVRLVSILAENAGRIVSVERIESFVWNDEFAGEGALRSLMFRLRHKLSKTLISCQSKLGYMIKTV